MMRMKRNRLFITWLASAVAILSGNPVKAEVLDKTKVIGGTKVHYKVVLPNNYDAAKAYPGILGFGGGPQTMNVVDSVISRNFRDQAEKRGYIVVVPAAPDGQLFFEGGERIFPEFLKQILADYKIEDNKFHIAGPSNGGIASFHVASLNPQYFLSITAFPGYLWEETPAHIQAISKMCINMFVGELDPMGWQELMQKQTAEFRAKGIDAHYTVEKGQPHRLETLAGANAGRLFDLFEKAQHGCGK
jgi:poly(3-hydroxybutyrate) depolymerase